MTTTQDTPDPPLVDPRLRRPLEGRVFRGVCAAMGRYTNTDPVLWRVIIAVTTVFGGAGIVLYLAGWLLIPEEGGDQSIAERHGLGSLSRSAGIAVIAVVGALVLVSVLDHGTGAALVVVLAVLGWAAWRHRQGRAVPGFLAWTTPPPQAPASVVPTDAAPAAAEGTAALVTSDAAPGVTAPIAAPPAPAWLPPPASSRPPRNGRLTLATLSLGALVTGVLLALQAQGRDITAVEILAADVVVVGLGLIAGAFLGRPRLLVTRGVLLALATGATAGSNTALKHGVGTRVWAPTVTSADYRLGSGEATLDLTDIARGGQAADYSVRVGFGHVVVIVPPGVTATIDASARWGDITGIASETSGERVHRQGTVGDGATPVSVRIRLTAGQIEVRHG
jgi:phage shock protein PspC (stress-responsive transcriptional regulator)